MTCIGTFTATDDGFEGRVHTLLLDRALSLVPAEPGDKENAPDYRVMAAGSEGAYEVGAGWKRVGEKAGDYVAVLIDDPAWVRPLRANLFQDASGKHLLVWTRRDTRA